MNSPKETDAGLKAQYSTIFLELEVYRAGRKSWRQATLGHPLIQVECLPGFQPL